MFDSRESLWIGSSLRRPTYSRWLTVLIVGASIVVSLLILELGSFIYFSEIRSYTSLENWRRHEYDPYRIHRLTPGHKRDGVEHNAQGFRRSKEVSKAKPAGTYRIFLMGGSTAYGLFAGGIFPAYTIANDETIDHYLELVLNQSDLGQRFEVINAAVSGYSTHHHLIYLNQELFDYSPDMVIFLDGHNDHYILDKHRGQFDVTLRPDHIQELNQPTVRGLMDKVLSYWAAKSWFGMGLRAGVEKTRTWNQVAIHRDKLTGDIEGYEEIARRTFLKMIKRNVLILKDEGITPVVSLQPELALSQRKVLTPEEQELLRVELSYRHEKYQEHLNIVNRKTAQLISELAEKYRFRFVDLREVFEDLQGQAYIDYVHLSPAGARHVAEFLGKSIVPMIEAGESSDHPHRGAETPRG
jgi:GDSL-like Lipase/Acylhydrolase family